MAGIHAEYLFSKGRHDQAAEKFSESEKTFEEVTLKFLKGNLYSSLSKYLLKVLDKIDKSREDFKPQRMLLCTWIVELKLNEMNNYQSSNENIKDK